MRLSNVFQIVVPVIMVMLVTGFVRRVIVMLVVLSAKSGIGVQNVTKVII